MIIVAIVALAGVVLAVIYAAFNGIPSFPTQVTDLMATFITYLRSGLGFVLAFVHPAPVKAMFAFTVALIGIYEGYKLVMWVAKKIPMFGVSD